MKAFGVLGLMLFVVASWTAVGLACVHKEKPDIAEPAAPKCGPATDVFMELSFPEAREPVVAPLLKSPASVEPMTVEPAMPEEAPEDSSPRSADWMLRDPWVIEQMQWLDELQRSKLGPDGRLKPEEAAKQVRNQEYSYLNPQPGEPGMSRPLSEPERMILEEEARNGWYVPYGNGEWDLSACWEYWLEAWGILIPATNPPDPS